MTAKHIEIGIYVSAVLMAISVFLPLTSLPIVGDVSYNRVADIESYIVIAFCIAGPALILLNKAKLVLISPVGVWLTLLFPAIKGMFKSDDGGFFSKVADKASAAMQDFAADLFLNVADFSWGGFVFLLALLALTVTCVLRTIK